MLAFLFLSGLPTIGAALPPEVNLWALNGENGFAINGVAGSDNSGISVAGAGDINGDGFDDVIIGAWGAGAGGKSYVVYGSDQGFPATLYLSALDGTNGFVVNGIGSHDQSGTSVAGAGDGNGDGIDDILIGAPYALSNGFNSKGQAYGVLGSNLGFPATFDLSSLDGANGIALSGAESGENAGQTVAAAGDVNADGIDDVIIGAPRAQSDTGRSYVVFGKHSPIPDEYGLSRLDGSNGFAAIGTASGDFSGQSVAAAGDVNGDGIDDIIIGAPGAGPAGQSYVVFGTTLGFPAEIDLSALTGANGFALNGINPGDSAGLQVAGAGDVNGDGIDDIVIGTVEGAPHGNYRAGQSYVVFGSTLGFPADFELSSLDGANGFILNGIEPYDMSGDSVAGAGDVNGDGIDDVIIGSHNGNGTGQTYVVFGTDQGFPAVLELSALDGSNGIALNGSHPGDGAGHSVAGAGDVNGDGIADIIIGAPDADPDGKTFAGRSYVVFGRAAVAMTISGTCPGDITIDITGAKPNGSVAIASASARGTSGFGPGACAGALANLASPALEATLDADAAGGISLTATVGRASCGTFIQSISWADCLVSNVARIP